MPRCSLLSFDRATLLLLSLTVASALLAQSPEDQATWPASIQLVEGDCEDLTLPYAEPTAIEQYREIEQASGEVATIVPQPSKPCVGCDKKKKAATAAKVKNSYKGLFYENDYSYLNDPCYQDYYPGDGLKQLSMPSDGKLDLGGEIRLRYHHEQNHRGSGLTGVDDEFWLTRLRLFANYRVNDWMRVYGEFLFADSGGQTFTNRVIEVNRGDAQNLFVDAKLFDLGDGNVTARLGRQELLYGNQRLISPLDWANTRRTFDGYRLLYNDAQWNIDGFFVNPVKRTLATQDSFDSTDRSIDLYGIYSTRKAMPVVGAADFYFLGINYDQVNANRQTFGSRVFGNRGKLLYEVEKGFQVGRNANGSNHFAGFFAGGVGHKLDMSVGSMNWKPTVWGWYDYASGDKNFANVSSFDNAFDQLYPLGHKYFGFIDLFGRRNIQDINAQFITPLGTDRVNLLVWYHYLMLVDLTTPYNVTSTPFNTTTAAASRDLGQEVDFLVNVAINPRNSFALGYSFFDSGAYYSRTSGGVAGTNGIPFIGNAEFLYAQYQMQF